MIFVRNMACFKRHSSNCCESKCEDRHGLKIFETKIQLKVNNDEFALYAVFYAVIYLKDKYMYFCSDDPCPNHLCICMSTYFG